MMPIFRSDMKRIFRSHFFWIATGLMFIVGLTQSLSLYPDPTDYTKTFGAMNCFFAAFSLLGYAPIIAPLVSVIPFASAYLDDLQTGYIKPLYMRMPQKRYLLQRTFSTALSGGLPILISYLSILGLFVILDPTPSARTMILSGAFVEVYHHSMLLYALLISFNAFVTGCVYALLGMGIAAVCNNRYIGLVATIFVSFSSTLIAWLIPIQSVKGFLLSILPNTTLILELTTSEKLISDYFILLVAAVLLIVISHKQYKNGRW